MIRYIYVFLILFAWFIQQHLLLNGDVGYLMHVAGQWAAGQRYAHGILETNPPLILWLYAPIHFAAAQLGHPLLCARLYFFALAICAFLAVARLARDLFFVEEKKAYHLLLGAVLVALFYLPAHEFGQRDHLVVIFILPYLFAAMRRASNLSLTYYAAIPIAIAASLGFALKPFYIPTFLLIEAYLLLCTRRLFRIENSLILIWLMLYPVIVYLTTPDYFHIMLPVLKKFYFAGMQQPWFFLWCHPVTQYGLFVCLLTLAPINRQAAFRHVLALATFGMLLAYWLPRTPWISHVLPALSFATILAGYYAGLLIVEYPVRTSRCERYPFFNERREVNLRTLAQGKNCDSPLENPHRAMNAPSDASHLQVQWVYRLMVRVAVIILLLIVPFYCFFAYVTPRWNALQQQPYLALTRFVAHLPAPRRIMCFSAASTADCFPLVYLSDARYVSDTSFYWWMYGVMRLPKKISPVTQHQKDFLFASVVRDIHVGKPCLVIINRQRAAEDLGAGFDFVKWFSQDPRFVVAWQHYKAIAPIGYYQLYQRQDAACRQ